MTEALFHGRISLERKQLKGEICYGLCTRMKESLDSRELTVTQLGALSNAVIVTVQFEFARFMHERNNKLEKAIF